jgi:hypothetical protein
MRGALDENGNSPSTGRGGNTLEDKGSPRLIFIVDSAMLKILLSMNENGWNARMVNVG